MSGQRVLVTGADGLVGSNLVPLLVKAGHEVTVWEFDAASCGKTSVDIRDRAAVMDTMVDVDVVVHLAAVTAEAAVSRDPATGLDVNIGGTVNVLESMRRRDIPRMVYLSSHSVYGGNIDVAEDDTTGIDPQTPYAASKYLAEELVRCYSRCYGIDATVFRSPHIYGPGQRVSALVPLFIGRVLEGSTIRHGNDVTRDLVFVDDISHAIVTVLPGAASSLYNLGTGIETRVTQLIRTIARMCGRKVSVVHDTTLSRDGAEERWRERANIGRITDEIGWRPLTSLEDGLRLMLQHVQG